MTEPHTLLGARRMISLGMLPVVVPDVGELQLIINVPLLWRFPILTLLLIHLPPIMDTQT